MSRLRLIDKATPTAKQAVIERIKQMANPREELQCPRCGCRTYLMIYNGATLQGGKMRHGTELHRCVCENCYKRGTVQSLLPEKLRVVKEPKPRRTKPKLIK